MGELKTTHTIMTMTISTAKKSVNISQSNELTEAAYYFAVASQEGAMVMPHSVLSTER